jgi:biotin transport system substrate-specific component
MSSSALSAPLHLRRPLVLADLVPGARVRDVLLVLGGAIFTGLLAQIAIPVAGSPVPVTGQTFAALTVGAALGWQRGAASLGLYMVAGMAGVPWYADGGSGFSFPSFGYVIGFVFAAALVGALANWGGDRNPLPTIATMVLGNAVIYVFGLAYLMYDLGIDLGAAWEIGMKNYLLGDALKILLAAGCLPAIWRGVDALHKR